MKIVYWLLGASLIFGGSARFCKLQTGSFTVARVASDLSFHPEWETTPTITVSELRSIISQPYFFLGKGAQSFVFASEDGKTVIKFFRHHHLSAPFWYRWIPFEWVQKSVQKKQSKLNKDFASYKLAYDALQNETGILYLHLNKSSDLHLTLDLVDKIGIHHPIPLDDYEFVIQKRATLSYTALQEWIDAGQTEQAKSALTALVQLLAYRSNQGIYDKDPDLNTNFGFIGTQPIQIDIGRFKHRAIPQDPEELVRITDNLHQWLMQRDPVLDEHLKTELRKATLAMQRNTS